MEKIVINHLVILWAVLLLPCSASIWAKERPNVCYNLEKADRASCKELDGMFWDANYVYVKNGYSSDQYHINLKKWHRLAKFKGSSFDKHGVQYWTDDSCLYVFSSDDYLRWVDFYREPFEILPNSLVLNGKHLISDSKIILKLDTLISCEPIEGEFLLINGEHYISSDGRRIAQEAYPSYLQTYYSKKEWSAKKKSFPLKCTFVTLVLFAILVVRNRRKNLPWDFSVLAPLCYLPVCVVFCYLLYEILYDPQIELGALIILPIMGVCPILLLVIRKFIHKKREQYFNR